MGADAEFRRNYEEAVQDLSEAELSQVARLSHSKLKEWVLAPKKIRPHLLKKWAGDQPFIETAATRIHQGARKLAGTVSAQSDKALSRLDKWLDKEGV